MSLKVYLAPHASTIADNNGVGRVIHAQYRYLPAHDIELVDDPAQADVIAAHMQQGDLPRVDVLHVHGLYWTGDPGSGEYVGWHHEANTRIIAAARQAYAISVPSPWVAECFKRDMRLTPDVIGHGIDVDAWEPVAEPGQYILWNKNRASDVCSPAAAQALAARGLPVVSTFGTPGPSMQITGVLPHAEMREAVRGAGVYLATTKETFGIGTLEALAAGVPVLGYRWGGTADLITHGVNGYLVESGDIDGLAAGYAWLLEHRATISKAARLSANRYTWADVMAQYAALYRRVAEQRASDRGAVSIVITNYNYGRYVARTIESAVSQTDPAAEVIVVDDGSTDDSRATIQETADWAEHHWPATDVRTIFQANAGVAAARNAGIAAARGDFIVCLDADDVLAPDYVAVCRAALRADRGLGVAYTGLGFVDEQGTIGENVWRQDFDWAKQATPGNPPATTIHCAAMFRKAMWERAGGYKQVYAPGEDAEFWTRGLSVGYRAKQVTDAPLFGYRNHDGSASKTKPYRAVDTWHPWMRDQLYPMAAPTSTSPLVRSYSEPTISVIIPCGPGHARHLPAALDSLLGQTFRSWEVIIIDDTGPEGIGVDVLRPYPFVRLLETRSYADLTQPPGGVALARNMGIDAARAPLLLFLDADDYLLPTALHTMLQAYVATGGKYVYTDWYGRHADGRMELMSAPEYRQAAWLERGQHAITALIPAADVRAVGGFDEALRGWEDWDFFIKLAIRGVCGHRVPEALLVYQYHTGQRRDESLGRKDELLAVLRERYAAYATGETMCRTCGGGNGAAIIAARLQFEGATAPLAESAQVAPDGKVRMEFIGPEQAPVWYFGRGGGRQYYAGNNAHDKYHNVHPDDMAHLEGTGKFRVIARPAVVSAAPPPPAAPAAPEPPTLDAAPLPFTPEDELTPEQEAALNAQVAQTARKQRKAQR